MKGVLSFLALAAYVSAQGPPPGCQSSFDGSFSIRPTNITSSVMRRDTLEKRQAETCSGTPIITLKDGTLTDQEGRTGEIVANRQFQFDNPVQQDSVFLTGFSICANGSLAVGGSAIFYQCASGDFANLYDQSTGAQCDPVYIDTIPCAGSGGVTASTSATASTLSTSSTPTTTSSVMVPTVPMTPYMPTTTPVTTPTPIAPPPTLVPPPFPVSNTTTPVGTASAPSGSPTGTTPATFNPANGADLLAVGGKLVAAIAGAAAFAMF
ncbi:MAG: hypothetical protein Q9190_003427 [Brigantiaea leucoxantha]